MSKVENWKSGKPRCNTSKKIKPHAGDFKNGAGSMKAYSSRDSARIAKT